tara:strand:+ start:157 stop:945 length:789 start_codon:yes stop_codon:yes gene_type:complete
MSKMKVSKKYKSFLLYLIFFLVLFDLSLNLYKDKTLLKKIYSVVTLKGKDNINFTGGKDNREWAKKILDGGYIIYIRHAERDKSWLGTGIYDLLETDVHDNGINGTRYAENDYFSKAVCLTSKGKIQAQAMGEFFQEVNVPVGTVISSPSCRARQTAEIMFGRYDRIDRDLIQSGVHYETKERRFLNLQKFFSSIPIQKNKNTVITAHGNVIIDGLFENSSLKNLKIDQGGMIILSREDKKVKIEHTFSMFNSFIRTLYERK